MNRLFSSDKPAQAPVFGLRYLEEEAVEINDIVGCTIVPRQPIDEDGSTYYTTNCDVSDID